MRRFFVNKSDLVDNCAVITGSEARHIALVLRLEPGEILELFDGHGSVYQTEIMQVSPVHIKVQVLKQRLEVELDVPRLIFAPGLLKGKKMDFLIQKATELGVYEFRPLQTRYSENKGNSQRQMERWQRIMFEACKQCNRPIPMQIEQISDLSQFAQQNTCSASIMLWEGESSKTFSDVLHTDCKSVCLMIGPEGGFHHEEVDFAVRSGFQTITMGHRILRAETAALSALSISQFIMGGFQPAGV